jgi:hypothetical protein
MNKRRMRMGLIIDQRYRQHVERVRMGNMSPFDRAVAVLESLDTAEEPREPGASQGEPMFDYSTIAKGVVEAYLGREIVP